MRALLFEIQRKMPSSDKILKKYLVCLVDYELATYSGQTQLFFIEDKGLDLLIKLIRKKGSMDVAKILQLHWKTPFYNMIYFLCSCLN